MCFFLSRKYFWWVQGLRNWIRLTLRNAECYVQREGKDLSEGRFDSCRIMIQRLKLHKRPHSDRHESGSHWSCMGGTRLRQEQKLRTQNLPAPARSGRPSDTPLPPP